MEFEHAIISPSSVSSSNHMSIGAPGVLLGIPIGQPSLESAIADALAAINRKKPSIVFACANTHSVVMAQNDPVFFKALNDADQVVADGIGVKIMGRIARIDVGPRIVGEEYFSCLMRALEERGQGRIFFFGSSDEVLQKIAKRVKQRYPSLTLCGLLSPPYRPWLEEENAEMVRMINDSRPDVLWVGMTAPKQEIWVFNNRHTLNVPVVGSIGAVFDFFAGTIPSPPRWVRKAGLEWLYRLFRNNNPRRFWLRGLSMPKLAFMVLCKHTLGRRR
jgi:N-acetylglucosaminyldiphosphoundecaprenol N-acetyl-beta-D-mannosaminyltransferase